MSGEHTNSTQLQHQAGFDGSNRVVSQSQWHITWRSLRRNPTAMFGLGGFLLLVLLTLIAPMIAPFEPTSINYRAILLPPNGEHLFGTDDLGRDVLSRVLWGGRQSLRVGLMGISIAMAGGVLTGFLAGYYGGWVDTLIMRLTDIFLAFPTILLVISIVAAIGAGLGTVLIALGISLIPVHTRLIRGSVLAAKNFDYVLAARATGTPDSAIMFRHIFPNVVAPIIIYTTMGLGSAIMLTAGLSYIGLGAQPPSSEWGAMLNYGRNYLRDAWWMSVFPGLAVVMAVLCINLLGDGLRDALDPTLRT